MNSELLKVAMECIKANVSIIPINECTKQPATGLLPRTENGSPTWKPYQTIIAGEETVRRWFASGVQAIAVVCGEVSGPVLVLDFDVPRFYYAWKKAVGLLAERLPVQETGRGGFHVFMRVVNPGGSAKLAWALDEAEATGRTIAIETKGEGGYVVIAPSRHPNGKLYKMLRGSLAKIPLVTRAAADALLNAARELDEARHTPQEQHRIEAQALAAHRQMCNNGNDKGVIGAFNQNHPIDVCLEKYGYTSVAGGRYVRPGGKSASVSVSDGRSCHFSTSDPLNDGKLHSVCGVHDSFGIFTHLEHNGDVTAAVKAAAAQLGIGQFQSVLKGHITARVPWPDPLPLPAGLPPVLPFNLDLLPAALRPWITDTSERMQCPPDYCAATAMIVAGALIGRKVAIRPKRKDDWQVVANLYGAMVGRPSLMKTPAMKEMLRFLEELEIAAKDEHNELLAKHRADILVAEATEKANLDAIKKAVKEGGDAHSIAESMASTFAEMPTRKRYIVNDTTVEKLGLILAENPNGILLFVDELASLFRAMEREGHQGDRAFYLTAWSGDSRLVVDRIGRGTLDIESAIVSIVGSIQPGVIAEYIRDAVRGGGADDGLIQRFQMTVWPDAPANWKSIDRAPNFKARNDAYSALRKLAELTPEMVRAQGDPFNGNAIPCLRFDPQAQLLFDSWREELEPRLRNGTEHPPVEAHLAKYRSLIPSLALITHLLDGGIGRVRLISLERAIGWGTYLESHARRLYAGVTEAPAVAARLMAARIQKGEISDNFAARDVYRNGWAGLDRERTETAIDVLISLGWLDERTESTTGKPRTRYTINPKIVIKPKSEPTKLTKAP